MADPRNDRRAGVARATALTAALVVLGGIALGLWSWRRATLDRETVRPAPREVSALAEPEPAAPRPERERAAIPIAVPREAIALPGERTDPLVRNLVAELTAHPAVAGWLASDDLLREFAVAIAGMAGGRSPSKRFPHLRPETRFQAIHTEAGIFVDPRSYGRYDPYAEAFSSLDPDGTARLYAGLRGLLQDAYEELGHEGSFDDALEAAIAQLLETPIPDGPVELEPLPATYEFADPDLAELAPAQKQFLRMGPRNMRLVQAKLRAVAPRLGLRASALP